MVTADVIITIITGLTVLVGQIITYKQAQKHHDEICERFERLTEPQKTSFEKMYNNRPDLDPKK